MHIGICALRVKTPSVSSLITRCGEFLALVLASGKIIIFSLDLGSQQPPMDSHTLH